MAVVTRRERLVEALPQLPIDPRHRDFADKIKASRVTEEDIALLGLSDDEVFDLVLAVSLDAARKRRSLGMVLIVNSR